jgi:hypothetical protein
MRIIHGTNYSLDERKKYKPLIINNIIDSIIRLVNAMKYQLHMEFKLHSNEENFSAILNCSENLLHDLTDWNQKSNKYFELIKSIWEDPNVERTYEFRNKFYIIDSIE